MPSRPSSRWAPDGLRAASHTTAAVSSASVRRARGGPAWRGARRRASASWARARGRVSPAGGKGGLAPAALADLQAGQAAGLVAAEPAGDGVARPGPGQAAGGDVLDGPAVGDLGQGGGP